MVETVRVAGSLAIVLAVLLACRGKAESTDPPAASVTAATAIAPIASVPPSVSATAALSTPSSIASATAKPAVKCKGLMLKKRCAKECVKDDDCADPKERCESYSGFDDDGQNVQGAQVCVYDANNTARAAKPAPPTIGAPLVNGDCAKGYLPSVTEANKCDKECKADAECGAGNVCKAVGPVGIGKQCQRK